MLNRAGARGLGSPDPGTFAEAAATRRRWQATHLDSAASGTAIKEGNASRAFIISVPNAGSAVPSMVRGR
jgi:hypothetical protein